MHIVSILAADYGFKYLFLWEPWILAQKPLSDREKVITGKMEKNIPNRIEVARATYELLQTVNQPHFVNLGDVFKDHPETLYVNPAQLRKEGNALVAEWIFQILQHAGS